MNKKIVTLACVTLLSGLVAGVNADELSLGGSVASKEDNAGLVVAEQPKEEKPAVVPSVQTEGENLDLGDKSEKEPSQDNTGVVVEPTNPSEKPKEDQPKEEQPKADTQKEDDSKVQEDKKKAEDNVGVKESDDPKPLNVTKEDIQEQPIETNTGHKVVSTNQGKVVVETSEGDYAEKEPYEIGAVKQSDGTIALKDKDGELKVLPNTGSASTIFASIWGFVGLVATVICKRKFD